MGISTFFKPTRMLRGTIFSAFLLARTIGISAQAQDPNLVLTRVAEGQLDSLASRVAERIKKNNRDENLAKVLVFDFTWKSPENSSRLGTLIADRFSEMLGANAGSVEVLDRKLLKDFLKDSWTDIGDLRSNTVCIQLATGIGATEIIRANLAEDEAHQLKVSLQAAGFEPVFSDETQFGIGKDMEDMLSQMGPSNHKDPETIPPEQDVLLMGSKSIDGVSSPTCVNCPVPPYSETARSAKISGTVLLSAVITTGGEVTSIYILNALPFGMTQSAINTVKNWKLKPAIKDGRPIAVRMDIKVTYKSL